MATDPILQSDYNVDLLVALTGGSTGSYSTIGEINKCQIPGVIEPFIKLVKFRGSGTRQIASGAKSLEDFEAEINLVMNTSDGNQHDAIRQLIAGSGANDAWVKMELNNAATNRPTMIFEAGINKFQIQPFDASKPEGIRAVIGFSPSGLPVFQNF